MEIAHRTPLWPHQELIIRRACSMSGYGIFAGVGAGKTKTAIDIVATRKHRLVLVVTIKSVLKNRVWEKEIAKHGHFPDGVQVETLDKGTTDDKANYLDNVRVPTPETTLFVVVNYDSVWRGELGAFIQEIRWDCVILDEGHKVRYPSTQVSKFLYKVGAKATHRLVLTGTAMPKSPLDAYGILKFINPKILGNNKRKFEHKYALWGGFQSRQVIGYKNLPELEERIAMVSTTVDTTDVINLPGVEDIYVEVDMPEGVRKAYRDLKKEMVAQIEAGEITAKNVLTKTMRLQQIANGYVKTDAGNILKYGTEKADTLLEFLEGMPVHYDPITGAARREPVVVFANFVHDIEVIKRVATDAGYSYSELSGNENTLDEWQAGKTDLLVAQMRSGSEGVDMTRACYVVFYTRAPGSGPDIQARGRAHRPGQTRNVIFVHLIVRGSVEVTMKRSLKENRDFMEMVKEDLKGLQ